MRSNYGYCHTGSKLDLLHDETSKCGYINIANVNQIVDLNESTRIQVDTSLTKYKRARIMDGDIVLTARGTKIKVGMARVKDDEYLIASSNIIVLRPNIKKVDSFYLKMMLDSETGKKLLTSVQTGATIITITANALESLLVPVPPIKEQAIMGKKYRSQYLKVTLLRNELAKAEVALKQLFEELSEGE